MAVVQRHAGDGHHAVAGRLQAHAAQLGLRPRIGQRIDPVPAAALASRHLRASPGLARVRGAEVNVVVLAVRPRGKGLLSPHRPRIVDLEAHPYLAALLAAVSVSEHVVGDLGARLRQVAAAVFLRLAAGVGIVGLIAEVQEDDVTGLCPGREINQHGVGEALAQQEPARRVLALHTRRRGREGDSPARHRLDGQCRQRLGNRRMPMRRAGLRPAVDVALQINWCVQGHRALLSPVGRCSRLQQRRQGRGGPGNRPQDRAPRAVTRLAFTAARHYSVQTARRASTGDSPSIRARRASPPPASGGLPLSRWWRGPG